MALIETFWISFLYFVGALLNFLNSSADFLNRTATAVKDTARSARRGEKKYKEEV